MIGQNTIAEIREHSAMMEESGRLTEKMLEYIYDEGLFKLFLPEALGGSTTPLPEALQTFETAAYADGSFGWLVQIGSGAGFFAATLSPKAVKEFFTARDFFIAGSDRPLGTARKTGSGYIINGTWPYASGALHANLFTATCRVASEDEDDGALYAFAFTPEQVSIEEDWNAFGMKATGSHTIHVSEAVVPAHRRFDVAAPHFYYDHPAYHYPFLPFASANIAATVIGVARHFYEAARKHIESKLASGREADARRHHHTLDILDANESSFMQARRSYYDVVETSWQAHMDGKVLDDEILDAVSDHSKIVAHAAVSGIQQLYRHLGMDMIMEDSPLNRIYRDLLTASQHGLLIDSEGQIEEINTI
ncbi:acyl-CoA dehydrogenase family protein [Salinicoccus siamensis]|uniref:Acyl-CoA dehydrogenase family protein n=1 Tax=Salinicoccus siamensis TaxID=381830 RepID=A0ABV5Z297_9STAP